jgi:phage baseplate assembly protein gpV
MSAILYDSIARIARHEANARAIAGIGIVTQAYGADSSSKDYAVAVKMRDTGILLPRVPIAVDATGFAALPAVNDLVVVLFVNGDMHGGVVVGRLYSPDLEPPENAKGQIVLRLPPGDSQPKINLVFQGDKPSISLTVDSDVAIECLKDKVEVKCGDIKVTLTSAGGGRAEIAAGGSTLTLKKNGEISISAQGDLKLAGANIEISAQGNLKIKGAKVDIN